MVPFNTDRRAGDQERDTAALAAQYNRMVTVDDGVERRERASMVGESGAPRVS
jgi:hypothetical protein